jgi:hypothetical protein
MCTEGKLIFLEEECITEKFQLEDLLVFSKESVKFGSIFHSFLTFLVSAG